MSSSNNSTNTVPALVFGANTEQGRAVVEGLVDTGRFDPVYAFTRETDPEALHYLTDGLGATLVSKISSSSSGAGGDLENPDHVMTALLETKATCIFLATSTEMPTEIGQTSGFADAAERECQVIQLFFEWLVQAYQKDRLARHVVFVTAENVQEINLKVLEETGELWIAPLEDGSIVPHFTAKAKGAAHAMAALAPYTPHLQLTLLTLPFLYSNFLGFFAPLQDETGTQWNLCACFGDGSNKIDMMGSTDLSRIVPNIFEAPEKYAGQNLRLAAERISMDEVAAAFSDLFGKDVIYNPLTVEEVAELPYAAAPAIAQECQFLGDPRSPKHDLSLTKEVCFPKKPQTFEDWLLTHSGSSAFARAGLDMDAPEILSVAVFGATSPEGTSVVKGLLADTRKKYSIRATTRDMESDKAQALVALDPERVELVYADFDDIKSCQKAAEGVDGAFLVTDFYEEAKQDMELEEQHARNVIDACEASATVRHLVFCTYESVEEMNRILQLGLTTVQDAKGKDGHLVQFDAKAKAAAYARTKKLSTTFVLMPCYSETFFDMIERRIGEDGNEKLVLTVPLKNDKKVMCMSVDDLGPAVANIFDSYQVYAGHEVGLVTDFVSVSEVRDIIDDVFLKRGDSDMVLETEEVSKEEWVKVKAKDTYMKDMGQMFAYLAHSDAVKMRRSVAKTMKLVPSARPLREWIEQNVDNVAFREKLGLR